VSEPQTIAPRAPQASKLTARVDVFFRLISDPDGELWGLENIPWGSVRVTRNRPSECDTASVTLLGDALPFDLRVIAPKSMTVSIWLYEADDPGVCLDGAPGQFFGVVDSVERDRYSWQVQLTARDLTAVPIQAKVGDGFAAQFEIKGPLDMLVEDLLRQIPGAQDWRVADYLPERKILSADSLALNPALLPAAKKGKRGAAPGVAKGRNKVYLSNLIGSEQVTVWGAITAICARVGVVAETRMGGDKNPYIVLVNGHELQSSDVLRRFERGNRRWRVFMDGDGIAALKERLEISDSSDRPDYVEVSSERAGRAIFGRWPAVDRDKRSKAVDQNVLFQYAPGVESVETLQEMARTAYESLVANQFSVALTAPEPWSAGGGPSDPDLLTLGYGALVEIAMPGFEAFAHGKSTEDVLLARGVDAELARRLAEAHARIGALSLLFQVVQVDHSLSNGRYQCEVGLRQAFDPGGS
jgi:hypothetical protein